MRGFLIRAGLPFLVVLPLVIGACEYLGDLGAGLAQGPAVGEPILNPGYTSAQAKGGACSEFKAQLWKAVLARDAGKLSQAQRDEVTQAWNTVKPICGEFNSTQVAPVQEVETVNYATARIRAVLTRAEEQGGG